jgi:hypothetical protein
MMLWNRVVYMASIKTDKACAVFKKNLKTGFSARVSWGRNQILNVRNRIYLGEEVPASKCAVTALGAL